MTKDDTEREKQKHYLKDQLRTNRAVRQYLEAARPPKGLEALRLPKWFTDPQLRWEAEQELDREEAEAATAAKRRQEPSPALPLSEPIADPFPPLSPGSELHEASSEAEIHRAILDVYKRTPKGEGPNCYISSRAIRRQAPRYHSRLSANVHAASTISSRPTARPEPSPSLTPACTGP